MKGMALLLPPRLRLLHALPQRPFMRRSWTEHGCFMQAVSHATYSCKRASARFSARECLPASETMRIVRSSPSDGKSKHGETSPALAIVDDNRHQHEQDEDIEQGFVGSQTGGLQLAKQRRRTLPAHHEAQYPVRPGTDEK
ncbi:hypothetical protein [Cupriavidus basilensis]|uniref:hypothetical protein n=1 Tax=Cupriavidus basilensis TaxID=68895 RepID=UPI0023E8A22B|nr:hypothetical protein [Cupriavidus basilensis]MDF3887554.1 hypothetical protein [Cupriavidus basilensis]